MTADELGTEVFEEESSELQAVRPAESSATDLDAVVEPQSN